MNPAVIALSIAIIGVVAVYVIQAVDPIREWGRQQARLDLKLPGIDIEALRRAPPGPDLNKIMQVIISVVVLAAAIYIVVFQHNAETSVKDWAFGAIGSIVGFWMKL